MAKAVFLFHECKQMLVKKELNVKKFAKHGELSELILLCLGNFVRVYGVSFQKGKRPRE